MVALRIERPSLHASAIGGVMVQSFRGFVTPEDIRAAFDHFVEIAARHPGSPKVGALTLASRARLSPSPTLARQIAEWNGSVARASRAHAFVYGGDGFGAALVRTAFASVHLIARPPFRERGFAHPAEAVRWLSGHLDLDADEESALLERALEVLDTHQRAFP